MQTLRDSNYGLAAPELAELCGLHVSTARLHLGILTESGMVDTRAERRRGRGLERMGAAEAHASLEPFVQPDVCLARTWPVTHSAAREPGRTDDDDAP